ncbi:MAG: Cobalamin biosynthesis protein CobW [Verrucomicrobiales bacterium]|nr:Cobalamin biosynthesis protein CobW [Verrucomicrobiales bacterium]
MKTRERLPVTVLTGFLGAGKTTLLNHLLTQKHGYKCAIIINEFGSISIDNQLVVGADEEIIELNNGCLCCRVRGDLIKSLNNLFQKQKRFDYVVIETTGLADPGPIAQTFGQKELADKLRLDGIITVVDARHFEKELNTAPETRQQVAFADVLLLNKADLVESAELEKLEGTLQRMNPLAKIYRTQKSQIDVAKILNIKAREATTPLPVFPSRGGFKILNNPPPVPHSEVEHHHHHHDDDVSSFYFTEDRPLDLNKTEAWLGNVINTLGDRIYRCKGILYVKGQPKRLVFQGVQMMFEAYPDRFWNVGEQKQSQLVFIGKELNQKEIQGTFESCLAT